MTQTTIKEKDKTIIITETKDRDMNSTCKEPTTPTSYQEVIKKHEHQADLPTALLECLCGMLPTDLSDGEQLSSASVMLHDCSHCKLGT